MRPLVLPVYVCVHIIHMRLSLPLESIIKIELINKELYLIFKKALTNKETGQNDFQVHVNREIFNIKLISGIKVCLWI